MRFLGSIAICTANHAYIEVSLTFYPVTAASIAAMNVYVASITYLVLYKSIKGEVFSVG